MPRRDEQEDESDKVSLSLCVCVCVSRSVGRGRGGGLVTDVQACAGVRAKVSCVQSWHVGTRQPAGVSIDMESQYKAAGSDEWGEIRCVDALGFLAAGRVSGQALRD